MEKVDGKRIIEYLTALGLSTKDVLTIDELKKNYRKLAKYYHPDNHETGDAEQFQKVQEAYEYCQENIDYVNEQIKANFTIQASDFSSPEEEAFVMTAIKAATFMKAFGFEFNEPLSHKKLDETYYKLSIVFQTVLRDYKKLKFVNDGYAFLKENFDLVNLMVACQFNYSVFSAAKAKAEEMRREQELREAEARAARERAEKERREREAREREAREKAERERREKEAEERRKAEEERKRREAELKARKEREAKEAKLFYKNRLEEEIEKIILSNYSDKNRKIIKAIFTVYRNKEKAIDSKASATNTISQFKNDISKVKTIAQQKIRRKRFTLAGIVAASMAVVVGVVFGIVGIANEVNKNNAYSSGISLMKSGDYHEAKAVLAHLGNYKEAENKIAVCDGLIMLESSIATKSENDAIQGIKKIISGGESVHAFYGSSQGHSVKKKRLYSESSQFDEIISDANFTLYKPDNSKNEGYLFKNWYSSALKYDEMAILSFDSAWGLKTYSITYHLDGGKNSAGNPTGYNIESDNIQLKNASKENYLFTGWYDKKINGKKVDVIPRGTTGDLNLYASYEINRYTVNFYNWNLDKLFTTQVDHGGTVVYPYSDPEKPADQQYTYTFSGWDKSLENITKNTDLIAQYSNTVNQYTVTFKNYDGTVLGTDTVDYGTEATYSGDEPLKPNSSDDRVSYTFSGWDISLDSITDNVDAVAQFAETNRYLARFFDGDNLLYSIMLNEGETPVYDGDLPTKAPTQQYSYTFDRWDPAPGELHEDVDYQPVFSSTLNQYTVTFKNYDGEVLDTCTVDYGTSAQYGGETPTKPKTQQYSYVFTGWDISLDNITDNVEATAQYNEVINKYTVTFKNYDGSILGTSTVDYGGTASYSGPTPTKPKTQQYTFSFSGWDISLENVTEDKNAFALYDSTVNEYTVTFKNYDGTVLYSCVVPYGDSAIYSGSVPTKPDEHLCTWTFEKWDTSTTNITGDTTITATFSAELQYAEFTLSSNGKYYTLDKCHYGDSDVIYVPDKHNGIPIRKIGDYAFSYYHWGGPAYENFTLRSVILNEGLTEIGAGAFSGCKALIIKSLYLPNSLSIIGAGAFGRCHADSFYIPENVTKIGDGAFISVQSLTIYCGASSAKTGWDKDWNMYIYDSGSRHQVIYGVTRAQYEQIIDSK